jgi:hypothetical protein
MPISKVTIDFSPKVDKFEACDLFIHHLRIAAAYFEATPEKSELLRRRIDSILRDELSDFRELVHSITSLFNLMHERRNEND